MNIEEKVSKHLLTREEKLNAIDELTTRIQTNDVRINMLKRLMKEENEPFKGDVSQEEYNQIVKEFYDIWDITNRYFLKKIKNLVQSEKKNSSPEIYLTRIEEDMIKEAHKIKEFFAFNKYANRRIWNLDEDSLTFIKRMAYQNEAYEFLEALKEK